MPEAKTVRVDQIEGLGDYIREEIRLVIRDEAKPVLQDMEEIKRSPAGMLIKLEDKLDALEEKMDQRFEVVDQRFEAVNQRFDAVNQRFESVNQRFNDLDRRFGLLQWVVVLIYPFLFAIAGKLFLMK